MLTFYTYKEAKDLYEKSKADHGWVSLIEFYEFENIVEEIADGVETNNRE